MIKIDKFYRVAQPKVFSKGENFFSKFSVKDSKRVGEEWQDNGWYDVFVKGEYKLAKGDKVKLTQITGIERGVYTTKDGRELVNYTIFAEIEPELASIAPPSVQPFQEQMASIDDEEMPF